MRANISPTGNASYRHPCEALGADPTTGRKARSKSAAAAPGAKLHMLILPQACARPRAPFAWPEQENAVPLLRKKEAALQCSNDAANPEVQMVAR